MTNPTIQKTWEFDLNNVAVANVNRASTQAHQDRRETMLGIKEALVNNGTTTFTAPWTVVSSSNSSTAGAADNWNTIDDLVWRDEDITATAFSWIVLRQTGISATFELLLALESDITNDDGAQIYASVAQAGFSGGNTTTAPTATDERVLRNDDGSGLGYWGSGPDGGAGYDYRWHVMMSSDGQCTRVLIFVGGINTGLWLFDKPDNPATGWANPYVAVISGANNVTINQATYSIFNAAAGMLGRYSGADTTIFLSTEGFANSPIGAQLKRNQLDNTWVHSEMGIVSQTATFVGRMGTMFDLWWGENTTTSGRYYPQAGTKLYVNVADMIFPWDGSSLLATR